MYKWLCILLVIGFGCKHRPKNTDRRNAATSKPAPITVKQKQTTINIPDDIIALFNDSSYKVRLYHIETLNNDSAGRNWERIIVTVSHQEPAGSKIVFKDSLDCQSFWLKQEDMNSDGVKDLLIHSELTGRGGNALFHLYLVNNKHHTLIRVKGFENVVSPELDSACNVITSIGLAGATAYYSFYRINHNNKLINLGHAFDIREGSDDTIRYTRAINRILKEHKE